LVKEEQAARAELAAQRDDALAALASTVENKTELGRTKQEVAHLRRELNAKTARLSATMEELEHAQKKGNAEEIQRLQKIIQHLQHKDNSTHKEVARLHKDLLHLKLKDTSIEQEANSLRKQLREMSRKLEQSEGDKSQATALRKQLQEMSRKLKQSEEEVNKLKAPKLATSDFHHKEMRKVTDQAMTLNKQIINALKHSHQDVEQKDKELMEVKAKFQKDENALHIMHKQLDAKIKLVAQLRKELSKDMVGSQRSHAELVKTFKELRQKLTSKDKTLHSSQGALKAAVMQLKALRQKLSTQDKTFHDTLAKITVQEQALAKDEVMLAARRQEEKKEKTEHAQLMQEIRVMQKEVQDAKAATVAKDGDLQQAHMKLEKVVEEMIKAKLVAKANEQKLLASQQSVKAKDDKLKAEAEVLSAQRGELVNATTRLKKDEEEIRLSHGEMQGEEQNLDNFIKEHKTLFEEPADAQAKREDGVSATTDESDDNAAAVDSGDMPEA